MTYLIDGSVNGLLTAVFNAFLTKKFPTAVSNCEIQFEINEEIIEIQTDKSKSDRVFNKLKILLPYRDLENFYVAFRSGDPAKYTVIFNYVTEIIKRNKNVSDDFSNPKIFNYVKMIEKVLREVHRFKGFVRFNKLENGIFYAKYFPDNDVILPHFIKRYTNMPFVLHDLNHDVVSAYFNGKTKTVNKKINPLTVKDEFCKLFKTYYDTVSIKERRNDKLMLNFMPKRYHKYMPEKDELI